MIIQNKVSASNVRRQFGTYCTIIDDPTGQDIRDKMHRQIQELIRTSGICFEDMAFEKTTVA